MKRVISLVLSMAIAMASLQGCYGKMALTRKVYRVNGEVGNKFARSAVTWAFIIVPVYGVSALVDFLLFNTIEFWSGKNPVAEGEKDFRYVENGENYRINARKSGDTVTYVINHFRGETYLDTLSINWDTRSGESQATLVEPDKVTAYQATRVEGGVRVSSSDKGPLKQVPEAVALYR